MELLRVLTALDDAALHALALRFAVPIDTRKRLALADQVARGLVVSPRRSRVERWPEELAEAVRLLLAAPRGLPWPRSRAARSSTRARASCSATPRTRAA